MPNLDLTAFSHPTKKKRSLVIPFPLDNAPQSDVINEAWYEQIAQRFG